MKTQNERGPRLASAMRRELAEMLLDRSIKELKSDSLMGLISITEVRLAKGYQHADVYISVFEESRAGDAILTLNKASSVLRGEICRRLQLRSAPTISFHADDSLKRSFKVWDLLDNIDSEP